MSFLVWADGLGNPEASSLHRCQVARVARLVMHLQLKDKDPSSQSAVESTYRIWADTFCCPVELVTKKIALTRIADIYRKATDILVIDKSIPMFVSEGKHPAELLLRIVVCSAWMRRLWTLQGESLILVTSY